MANQDISRLVGTSFTITSGLIYVDELASTIRKLDPVNGDRLVDIVMRDNTVIEFAAERLNEVRLGMLKGIDFSNCQSYEEIVTLIFMNNLKGGFKNDESKYDKRLCFSKCRFYQR